MYKHKSLARTWLFWCALGVPLVVGLCLGAVVFASSDLGSVCGSSRCIQNFFGHFKFPVAIMGASLPLVAMVAAIHRSREAALQIEYVSKQYGELIKNNRFGNYLKHRETFEKLMDSFCERHSVSMESKFGIRSSRLYARLFPKSGYGALDWAGEYDLALWGRIEKHLLRVLDELKSPVDDFDLGNFMSSLEFLLAVLEIDYVDFVKVSLKSEGGKDVSVHVEANGDEEAAMHYAVCDIIETVVMLRGFLGLNNFADLLVGISVEGSTELFNFKRDQMTLENYSTSPASS